ncbi:MAG TPA: TIGR04283 family arsenosugar biosynthesis glycosyltransferase [Alphaproteobacteria bacterium]|nr:TIGR04283 family arsenosugar biosynthesis glycosyltransferase [Alphaproteobacteria bacterium]
MLSIVIPTLNAAATLPGVLDALSEARTASLEHEIIVSDGGSKDGTAPLAEAAGARVRIGPSGRGRQLAAGAEAARGDWLLFLHADTRLAPGWILPARNFMATPANGTRAAYFRLAFDDNAAAARLLEAGVRLRCALFALPYGDQGLLLSRPLYDCVGGFHSLPLMEDVDMARRLGRRRLVALPHLAHTSAERYRRDGWIARPMRNLACIALYFLGVAPERIAAFYRRGAGAR